MSDPNHADTELFETTDLSEGGNDTVSTTDDAEETTVVVEENKKDDADARKQKQVNVWKFRVETGEANLDDAPAWVAREIESQKKAKKQDVDIEELVEKKVRKLNSENEFKALKKELKSYKMDAQSKEVLQ